MSKHPNGGGRRPDPKPDDDHRRNISGSIHVSGEVEAKLPFDLVKTYTASSEKDERREDKRFFVEKITLVFVALVAVMGMIQTGDARRSADAVVSSANTSLNAYEATSRPYIGMAVSALVHGTPEQLQFVGQFKNYGPIPASEFSPTWMVVVDGKPLKVSKDAPDVPSYIYPTETHEIPSQLPPAETSLILNGTSKLVIYLSDQYRWRDKKQSDCDKFQFWPQARQFFDLGPICYPN